MPELVNHRDDIAQQHYAAVQRDNYEAMELFRDKFRKLGHTIEQIDARLHAPRGTGGEMPGLTVAYLGLDSEISIPSPAPATNNETEII